MKLADAGGREGWVDANHIDNLDLTTLPEADKAVKTTAAPEAAAPRTEAVASVAPDAAPAVPANGNVDRRTVGGTGVNVRSGPSNGNARLFGLSAGTPVIVTGSDKGWLRIIDANGRTGWAYSDFLSSAAQ